MLLSVFCLCLSLLQVVVVMREGDHVAFPLSFEGPEVFIRHATTTTNPSEPAIIGGEAATEGQFPWQVSLTIHQGKEFFCGGSVVSHEFVLTAAHCLFGKKAEDVQLFFGSLDNIHKNVSRGASALIMHESFVINDDGLFNDVALVRLDSPLPEQWTPLLQAVRLPRRAHASLLLDNEETTMSGWGKTSLNGPISEKLRWITLTVMPLAECAAMNEKWTRFINETHICTKSSKTHSMFKGDSGGPLVWKDPEGVLREVGIASYVSFQDTQIIRNVFTRVSAFLDWIESNIGLPFEP